jgi:8-oxo-dGTP pyrophosphatase MutT (NUDIX family)
LKNPLRDEIKNGKNYKPDFIIMREIQRDIVAALIFSRDGKLFLGWERKGGVYDDCWHIPGGGVDPGENKEEALKREVKEETGIDITGYKIDLIDDTKSGESKKILPSGEEVFVKMKFYDYRVDINDKNADEITVSLNDDLVEYRWTTLDELPNLKLTPPSTELFKKLGYLK